MARTPTTSATVADSPASHAQVERGERSTRGSHWLLRCIAVAAGGFTLAVFLLWAISLWCWLGVHNRSGFMLRVLHGSLFIDNSARWIDGGPIMFKAWPASFKVWWWGFRFDTQFRQSVELSLWPLIVLGGAVALLAHKITDMVRGASHWRRRRRARRHKVVEPCAGCGYDRTGVPASSPCPECGRAISARLS